MILKFRAWDGSEMRYDVTGFEHGINNEMAGIFIDGDYYSLDEDSLSAAMDGRHAIAMQWTGLLDKNGVEIYEGDIVQEIYTSGYKPPLAVVRWHQSGACFTACLSMTSKGNYEVIGNIYENPELIGEDNGP
jgi:uncharacterized phage protein (TIGR01671 family)